MMNTHWHGHMYVCEIDSTGEVLQNDKLPPILRTLRERTNHEYKIPHGNKVRTMIIEQGACIITCNEEVYRITVKRW